VSENADVRAPLSLEEVAQAVLELGAERNLEDFVTLFRETVRRWAAPSALLAAVRDPAAESGWKLLPVLCAGSGPLGAERSVRQLIEDVPQDLARPSLVRAGRGMAGVRVRENCVVPWSCEGESGVLMLRGVVDSSPRNLAEAVALLAAPVWPRLLGGPAARVEASVAELRRVAARLHSDADRQLERLQAARPPVVAEPSPEAAVDAGRMAVLEEQLTAAREEVARLLEERRAGADWETSLRAAERSLAEARTQITDAERSVAQHVIAREELRQQVASLEKALGEVEEERDQIRREANRQADELEAARAVRADPAVPARPAEPSPGPSETVEVLRRTLAVLRRTPFIPPPLRVAAQEAEALVGGKDDRAGRRLRIAVLDRDIVGLEALAAELEAEGLDVRIAGHPEELALLLKTAEGRELDAAICDVLAFRPDQIVAGIFRGWEKDRPGLALYLAFSRDSPAEVERAQRVPQSLTQGRFQRPLNRQELMDVMGPLRRRTS
jgi:hypothetical protein